MPKEIRELPEDTLEQINVKLRCYAGDSAELRNKRRDLEREHAMVEQSIRETELFLGRLFIKFRDMVLADPKT